MIPEKCDECFDDISNKVDKVVNLAKNQILKMSYDHTAALEAREKKSDEFFKNQEIKHDKYLEKSDKREGRTSSIMMTALVVFAASLGYMFDKQSRMSEDIGEKINRCDALTLTEAQLLREQGDRYYNVIFQRKDTIKGDTITYIISKNNVWKSVLRGERVEYEKIPFSNTYEPFKSENKNKN